MGCLAKEQAFSPVLHEVIVSELQSRSGSWAGPVHAEALMWLLPVVLGSSRAGPRNAVKCWQLQRKIWRGKKKGGVGGVQERERKIIDDTTWREKKELRHSQNLVLFRLDMPSAKQALYISFWGSHLFWCNELLLHKSVHYYAYEEGCSGRASAG